jgi:hypothetical protein
MVSAVKTFKLVSGEEVIGIVKEETPVNVTLESPRVMVIQPTPQGVQIGLAPVLFGARNQRTLVINLASITTSADADIDMQKNFLEQTSGIAIATKI